jgi:hypothetical protein
MVWPTTIIAHRSLLLVPRHRFFQGQATGKDAPWSPACVNDGLLFGWQVVVGDFVYRHAHTYGAAPDRGAAIPFFDFHLF